MPTLETGSRYDDIHKSVNAYIDANIRVALGHTVYYMGIGRTGALPKKWIEADLIPASPVQSPIVAGPQSYSSWMECYLNLNFFQLTDEGTGTANVYALITMVDDVRSYFEYNASIPIRDYNTVGTPIVGYLRVLEKPDVNPMELDTRIGARQINVSVSLRHHEVVTN